MPINQEHDITNGARSLWNGYYVLGNGKLICPQEVDTRLHKLPEYVLWILEVTAGTAFNKPNESRYKEYKISPVSSEERQKIILEHQWAANVHNACSRILGGNSLM